MNDSTNERQNGLITESPLHVLPFRPCLIYRFTDIDTLPDLPFTRLDPIAVFRNPPIDQSMNRRIYQWSDASING